MVLSEIKTNTQKWETKDEPQTNDSYTIRQIIIKIIKYTHIHVYSWAKSKQSNKNKVQYIDPVKKEIKNYIYHLRTKVTKAQTWKLKQNAKWGIKQWKQN